jgi:hypothetical protein
MPGAVPVGALPTIEEAEADQGRREAEVRARIPNPFICGPDHAARSSLPEPIFQDWLRDAGIEPTQTGQNQPVNWFGWWEQAHKRLSAEQIAHVWAGLNRVRFFEVVTRPEGHIGYAVVRINWEYNDSWYEPDAEGGTPVKVFRKWAAAEERRHELDPNWGGWDLVNDDARTGRYYEVARWTDEAFWPLGPTPAEEAEADVNTRFSHDRPLYEVIEIELADFGDRT